MSWLDELPGEKVAWWGLWIILALWLIFGLISKDKLPLQLPLFYSKPWGEEQLVPTNFVLGTGIGVILIIILNTIFGRLGYKTDKFLGRLFLWSGVLASILLLITITRIWLIFL